MAYHASRAAATAECPAKADQPTASCKSQALRGQEARLVSGKTNLHESGSQNELRMIIGQPESHQGVISK